MSLIAHQTAVFKGGTCLRSIGFASLPCHQQVPRVRKISEGLLRATQIMPEDVQRESSSPESIRVPEQTGRNTPGPGLCCSWRGSLEKPG